MKMRFFGCGKFNWLASEREDRDLTARELRFLARHRSVCDVCAKGEEAASMALNMLRQARLEDTEASPRFNRRVIRRFRLSNIRGSFQYWSPAVYGAAIAAVALIAALQLLARSSQLPVFRAAGADARRIQVDSPVFPTVPIANRIRSTE